MAFSDSDSAVALRRVGAHGERGRAKSAGRRAVAGEAVSTTPGHHYLPLHPADWAGFSPRADAILHLLSLRLGGRSSSRPRRLREQPARFGFSALRSGRGWLLLRPGRSPPARWRPPRGLSYPGPSAP